MDKDTTSTLNSNCYRMIFDSVDEGINIIEKVDSDQNERIDFRYVHTNPAFESITGLTDVVGKTVRDVVRGVNDSTMQVYDNILKTGQPVRFETYETALDQWFSAYAFPIDDPELKRVAVIFNDISDIKKSEIILQENAARKEYVLNLSDAMRSIEDPVQIQLTACRVLGEQIGASRVLYEDVVNEQEFIISHDYVNGVPSIASRLVAADFSQFVIDSYLSEKPVIIKDVSVDPRLSEEERTAFQSIQVAANISLGLVKDGKWVAALVVHHNEPRNWTPLEISLMEETAERTWAAVERARAEEKYRLLFNLIDQGFFVIDVIFDENDKPVDMYYVEANHAATKMLGIDFTGKRLRDIDSNYEEYWFEIFGNVAMTGQSVRMEQYAEPDKKWYGFNIFKIGDEKSRRIGNIFLDITESKQAEEALKESEQLYRTLFENTEDGFVLVQPIFDESGYSDNYLMLNMNQAWEKQTGLKADDFVGKTIKESMPGVESSWPEAFANVAKSGERIHFDSFNHVSNRWYDLYVFNYKEGLVGVLFQDISERKKTEQALVESEERMRALTVASTNVVYRMNPDWSSMTELYGNGFLADTDESNARWLEKYVHPEDHEFMARVINECIREKKLFEMEHRILQEDGSIGWIYSKAAPLMDDNEGIKEWIGSASDITERKRVEEALSESEAKLLGILEQLPVGVSHYNLDGQILLSNSHYSSLIPEKMPSRDLERMNYWSAMDDEGHALHPDQWPGAKSLRGDTVMPGIEFIYADQSGQKKWFLVSASPFRTNEGEITGGISVVENITERKRAEEALRKSEERFRVAQEISPDGFTILHPVRDEKGTVVDFTWVYQNDAIARIYGTDPGKIYGKRLLDVFPGHRGTSIFEAYMHVASTGESQILEQVSYIGETIQTLTWFRLIVVSIGEDIMIMAQDITERKRAEDALRESEQKYRTIIETSGEGIVMAKPQGNYLYVNQRFSDMLGYSVDELLGKSSTDLCYPEDHEQVIWARKELDKSAQLQGEFKFRRKDGTTLWTMYNATSVFDDAGKHISNFVMYSDITERKRAEKVLREHQEQLLKVEQEKSETLEEAMKLKDEFLYLITHEFKTPIAVISSVIQAIDSSMKTEVSEKLGRYLNMIKMNTNRQHRLVDNLLDIAKMNSGNLKFNMAKIDIVYVTKAILKSVELYALQRSINLSFTSTISKKEIIIDEEKYERIMLNLLSNAVKFTPKDKLINVILSTKKLKNQNFVSIRVIDEGIGIPADKQQIIFERFGQADTSLSRQAEGTGLGLHLVELLVKSMGGVISVKSEVGYGSTFTVLLPIKKQLGVFNEPDSNARNGNILDANRRIIQATRIEFSDIYLTANTKR